MVVSGGSVVSKVGGAVGTVVVSGTGGTVGGTVVGTEVVGAARGAVVVAATVDRAMHCGWQVGRHVDTGQAIGSGAGPG